MQSFNHCRGNLRLFLGIFPSEEIQEDLTRLTIGLPDVKWVEKENFHLTLQFLGNVEENDIHSLIEHLSTIQFSPFEIHLTGIGYFGESRSIPIWIGVNEKSKIIELKNRIDKPLKDLNFQVHKNFHPHLTLGRLKRFQQNKWNDYFETFKDFRSQNFVVSKFDLIKSTLTPHGSIYEVLESFG